MPVEFPEVTKAGDMLVCQHLINAGKLAKSCRLSKVFRMVDPIA
jgi:hypothetical protein